MVGKCLLTIYQPSVFILIPLLLAGCIPSVPTGQLSLTFQDHMGMVEESSQSTVSEKKQDLLDTRVHIELIIGASGSMLMEDEEGKVKIQEAKKEALKAIEEMGKRFQNPAFGLRVYGAQSARQVKDCQDTKLLVPIGKVAVKTLRERIQSITTQGGMAPIAFSIKKAMEDLERLEGRKIIILFTDGKETCSGNLCQIVSQAMASGFEKPLIHVIGLLPNDKNRRQLECVANLMGGEPFALKSIEKQDKTPKRTLRGERRRPSIASYIYTLYGVNNEVVVRQSIRGGTILLHNLSPGRYWLHIETQPENLPGFPLVREVYVQENKVTSVKVRGNQLLLY